MTINSKSAALQEKAGFFLDEGRILKLCAHFHVSERLQVVSGMLGRLLSPQRGPFNNGKHISLPENHSSGYYQLSVLKHYQHTDMFITRPHTVLQLALFCLCMHQGFFNNSVFLDLETLQDLLKTTCTFSSCFLPFLNDPLSTGAFFFAPTGYS